MYPGHSRTHKVSIPPHSPLSLFVFHLFTEHVRNLGAIPAFMNFSLLGQNFAKQVFYRRNKINKLSDHCRHRFIDFNGGTINGQADICQILKF